MQAGNLRKRATLQQKSSTQDDFGQYVVTWSTVASLWCEVEALSGNERLQAKAFESEVRYRVTVRFRSEFATPPTVDAWRVLVDGRTLNIVAAMLPDMKKRYVVLDCTEG